MTLEHTVEELTCGKSVVISSWGRVFHKSTSTYSILAVDVHIA